jgi:sulfur carrier protein
MQKYVKRNLRNFDVFYVFFVYFFVFKKNFEVLHNFEKTYRITSISFYFMEETVTISANGKPVEIPGEMSVSKLLEEINVEMPEYVSVQLNGEMLLRDNFDTTPVKEGAVVEFLYYMGGGGRGALPCLPGDAEIC